MKAEAKGFKFLSLEGKVKIPFFQRTYVWDKDNWEDLLSELLRTKRHFLGSIILSKLFSFRVFKIFSILSGFSAYFSKTPDA